MEKPGGRKVHSLRGGSGELRLLEANNINGTPGQVDLDVVALVLVTKPANVPAAEPEGPSGVLQHGQTSSTRSTRRWGRRRSSSSITSKSWPSQPAHTLGGWITHRQHKRLQNPLVGGMAESRWRSGGWRRHCQSKTGELHINVEGHLLARATTAWMSAASMSQALAQVLSCSDESGRGTMRGTTSGSPRRCALSVVAMSATRMNSGHSRARTLELQH